jgi:hypothetical protein
MKVSHVSYKLPLSHLVSEEGLAYSQQLFGLNSTQRRECIPGNNRKPAAGEGTPSWEGLDNGCEVPRREVHHTEVDHDEDNFSTGMKTRETYSKPTYDYTRTPAKTARNQHTFSGSQRSCLRTTNYQDHNIHYPESSVAGHAKSSDSTSTRAPSSAGSATRKKATVKAETSTSAPQRNPGQSGQRLAGGRRTTYSPINDLNHWINHGRDDPVPSIEAAYAGHAGLHERVRRPY